MRSYREVFAVPSFRVLFAGNAISVAGLTMQGLALSALVYARTGSPLIAALAYLGGFLPQAIGAATLLSWADRLPPRGFLVTWDCVRATVAMLLATGILPVWAMLALVMTAGTVDAVAGAVRSALLADILPGDGFVLGRSVLNISVGAMQIAGFAIGGILLAGIGPQPALLAAGILALTTAAVTRAGLAARAPRATGRASFSTTTQANRRLLRDPLIRTVLLAQWLPNGLIVGAEALFVPYAGNRAGTLFVAAALGMLAGDVVVGRLVPPRLRARLIVPLCVLLAVPYLAFFAKPTLWWSAGAVAIGSLGFAATLGLQERLLALVPEDLRGQAFGLANSGMMTMQAVAATLVGIAAEATSPAVAVAIAACASLAVTGWLAPRLLPIGISASRAGV